MATYYQGNGDTADKVRGRSFPEGMTQPIVDQQLLQEYGWLAIIYYYICILHSNTDVVLWDTS